MQFKGENLKNQLWACARSSSVLEWNANMEMMKDLNEDAYNWLGEMSPNTWVRAFFSEFPKCDILLNNSCEVFNKYILEARELPILSMLEKIKGQLMSRFYNKQKEAEKWEGPFCPKIGKKLLKNAEHANICYVLPAGKGIFQVQERQSSYTVDVIGKHCDCRRWDLTGIPCCHAIACIKEERLSEQDFLPFCYSIEAFKSVYANNIMPCSDRANWEKMNGPQVLPPAYEKKVGKPKKTRRKHPTEVQGKNGPKLTKHGVIIHCSYCHEPNHNKKGCPVRKKGIKPNIQIRKKKDVALGSQEPSITQVKIFSFTNVKQNMLITNHIILQEMMGTQPGTSTGLLNEVNDNMLSVMMAEVHFFSSMYFLQLHMY